MAEFDVLHAEFFKQDGADDVEARKHPTTSGVALICDFSCIDFNGENVWVFGDFSVVDATGDDPVFVNRAASNAQRGVF